MSLYVRRSRDIVATFPDRSALFRDLFCEVGLVSGRDRRGRHFVRTCPARSGLCRDLFSEVGLVS